MSTFMTSTLALIVTLGLLIAFHEYGHFWTARRLGVKVLRFSIGFGKPLWTHTRGPDQTEYVLAVFPLGGYVKMLDEREGEVAEEELHRAFNRQSVWSRFAIVIAGPMFNFIFAVLALWLMYLIGVSGVKPIIGEVEPESVAAVAGFRTGDEIISVEGEHTPTWSVARIALLDAALDSDAVSLQVRSEESGEKTLRLPVDGVTTEVKQKDLLGYLGISPYRPTLPAVLGELEPGGPAEQAGLLAGDKIIRANNQVLTSWLSFVDVVRANPGVIIQLEVDREGEYQFIAVTTEARKIDSGMIGRIGAAPAPAGPLPPELAAKVQYSFVEAFGVSISKTWQLSTLTLRMIGKMIIGEVSLDNLSGPITIATYAGYTASVGAAAFLYFLAIVSISLGVLNLLPVPLLDGGHLMYYLVEMVKGSPLSDAMQLRFQKIGIAFLVMLMTLALYNDIARLITD